MKLKELLIVVLVATSLMATAQEKKGGSTVRGNAALPKGGNQLNFGLPGYIGWDIAVEDYLTLGPKAQLGIFDNNNHISLGVVADFHFNTILGMTSEWDFYAGLSGAFKIYEDTDKHKNGFDIGGQIGGRYYWNSKWGINVEAGFSGSLGGGIGVTMKF